MLDVVFSNQFKRDLKQAEKRGYDLSLLEPVIDRLVNGIQLPKKYKDHSLKGEYSEFRECHIQPDWLLVYRIENDKLMLFLSRTGTHSDLF